MPELQGILKTPFRNWLFRQDYNWADGSYKVPGSDREIAVIRQFLLGHVADVRLSAQDANATVSLVQAIDHAAETIRDKLILMEELAEKAATGHYTTTDRASMQKQLEKWAGDINEIVDGTEYDGNKLFTTQGQTISRSIGSNRTIHLFARDLRFGVERVDLTQNAEQALTTIEAGLKQAREYVNDLKRQNSLLQDAMAAIEYAAAGAAGVDSNTFTTQVAPQFVTFLSSQLLYDTEASSRVQFNITADEALQLLKD